MTYRHSYTYSQVYRSVMINTISVTIIGLRALVTLGQRFSTDSGACNQRKRAIVGAFRRRTHEADRHLWLQEEQRIMYRARILAFVLCLAVCSEIGHVTPRRGAEAVHARDCCTCTTLASVEPSSCRSSTLTGCGIGCPP
jgi:hypothetical protein